MAVTFGTEPIRVSANGRIEAKKSGDRYGDDRAVFLKLERKTYCRSERLNVISATPVINTQRFARCEENVRTKKLMLYGVKKYHQLIIYRRQVRYIQKACYLFQLLSVHLFCIRCKINGYVRVSF